MTVNIKQESKHIDLLCAMFSGQPCIRNLLQVRNTSFSSLHTSKQIHLTTMYMFITYMYMKFNPVFP